MALADEIREMRRLIGDLQREKKKVMEPDAWWSCKRNKKMTDLDFRINKSAGR